LSLKAQHAGIFMPGLSPLFWERDLYFGFFIRNKGLLLFIKEGIIESK